MVFVIVLMALECQAEKNKGGVPAAYSHYSTSNYYPQQQTSYAAEPKYEDNYPPMIVPSIAVKGILRAQRRQEKKPNSRRAQRDRYYSAIFAQMTRQVAKQMAEETIKDLDIFKY